MRYGPLSIVRHRVQVGAPLPFNVFDSERQLLLARGVAVASEGQLQALLARGSLIDLVEVHSGRQGIADAPPELLVALWADCSAGLRRVLAHIEPATFRAALDAAAEPVQALIERDPDLAIVQVVRQEGNAHTRYGVDHAMHSAIACWLVAGRLGWHDTETQCAFKAALTMNLSIFELQGFMAEHRSRPSPQQREQILSHPARSRMLLEQAGVNEPEWLDAVEQHHETADGAGYPNGLREPSELATLLNRADLYAARLSRRSYRDALPADRAARELFASEPGNPIVAALVKELGVYPPGCHVVLASGETGVVVRRGPTVMTPLVAVLLDRHGVPLAEPLRRDTGQRPFAVASVVAPKALKLRLEPEQLAWLIAA